MGQDSATQQNPKWAGKLPDDLRAAWAMRSRFGLPLAAVASIGIGALAGVLLWQATGPHPRVATLEPPLVTAAGPAERTETESLAESLDTPRPAPMLIPESEPGAVWQDEESGVPGDQIAELITRQDELPYMESLAPEQLAAAIIAKPSEAEIDAALAGLDLAAFVPAGINAGDPPAWRRNAVVTPAEPGGPVIAVVLDDLGLNRPNARRAIALPGPLTLAFMTYAERLPAMAVAARAAGHELLVHVPMAPQDPLTNPGPNVLRADLGPQELARRIAWGLARFDGYVGINNHMGSGFTTSVAGMAQVMMELKARGLLYLDSLTSPGTVGAALAERLGVPYAKRDIFIDNEPENRAAIRRQLVRLERLAARTGRAVGIAHPHDVTLEELARWLPEVQARGFRLVPISAVVREGGDLTVTPASSSGSG
jgi:polysaccharide deacetylase 2 family uncharacterized protein YibQ